MRSRPTRLAASFSVILLFAVACSKPAFSQHPHKVMITSINFNGSFTPSAKTKFKIKADSQKIWATWFAKNGMGWATIDPLCSDNTTLQFDTTTCNPAPPIGPAITFSPTCASAFKVHLTATENIPIPSCSVELQFVQAVPQSTLPALTAPINGTDRMTTFANTLSNVAIIPVIRCGNQCFPINNITFTGTGGTNPSWSWQCTAPDPNRPAQTIMITVTIQ